MIKNIKLTVETDEQNQYVLNKLLHTNKNCPWFVDLNDGDGYGFRNYDYARAVCSVWKELRCFVIDDDGNLILCKYRYSYENRKEREITFEEFREIVGDKPKTWIVIDGIKYKRVEEEK